MPACSVTVGPVPAALLGWSAWWNKLLFGPEPPGVEHRLQHSWPWPAWATVVLLLLLALLVAAVYVREAGSLNRRRRGVLMALRLSLLGLLVWIMFGWTITRYQTDLPDLIVALDASASMLHEDHYEASEAAELKQLTERGGLSSLSRWDLARSLLLADEAALLSELQERYHVKFYLVSAGHRLQSGGAAQLAAELRQGELEASDSEAQASRLGTAARHILEAQRGRPTAALLLLTDGITTEGKSLGDVADYADRKNVPLFVVGLGNSRAQRDVRLGDLLADDVAFVGDLLHFDFSVSHNGFPGKSLAVRLRTADSNQTLDEQQITLQSSGGQPVRLTYRPPREGTYQFIVSAEVLEGEVNPANNVLPVKQVEVRDETIRVLYVQEYPSFEFKFLKSLLRRGLGRGEESQRSIELTTVLQEADPRYVDTDETAINDFPVSRSELFKYDVLIFGDANPSFFPESMMENVVAFVQERGGGLVFLSGPRHTPLSYRDTPLELLFPFRLATAAIPPRDAVITQGFSPQLSDLGRAAPQMQLNDGPQGSVGTWSRFPAIYWYVETPDMRPGARVLLEHPNRRTSTGAKLPIVTMQFAGAGKILFHATDESYRWSRHLDGSKYYARYWLQTLRYLSRGKLLGGNRAVELTSDRERYDRGEPVNLRVRFLDDRLAPPQDDGVRVVLDRDAGKQRQLELQRGVLSRGVFEGTFSSLPEGRYRAWLAAPALEGQPASTSFEVLAPSGEQARLEMDLADLKRAAATSGGELFTPLEAERLVQRLPAGRRVRVEPLPPKSVWNLPLFAMLFVGLIVSEWLLRKRFGLL